MPYIDKPTLATKAANAAANCTSKPPLSLRDKSAESQRRIMRTYGFAFAYLEGEAVDAEDEPDVEPPA